MFRFFRGSLVVLKDDTHMEIRVGLMASPHEHVTRAEKCPTIIVRHHEWLSRETLDAEQARTLIIEQQTNRARSECFISELVRAHFEVITTPFALLSLDIPTRAPYRDGNVCLGHLMVEVFRKFMTGRRGKHN